MDNLTDDPLLLPRLLIGLEALDEQHARQEFYPNPPVFAIAWNALTLRLLAGGKIAPPTSLPGLLALCARPVSEWFPASLPCGLPDDTRLLHSGGGIELTGTASRFLSDEMDFSSKTRTLADAAKIERFLQNQQFVEKLEQFRNASDRERAQKEYVIFRRFLITRAFATTEEIRSAFAQTSIKPAEVGIFYRDCEPEERYYNCPNCGPLRRHGGRWRGAKPDVCSDHLGEDLVSHAVPFRDGLRHLHAAAHERICLHGIEEVRWLDAARQLKEGGSDARNPLINVEDWPGIDIYDLRLTFADGEVWAADMKDYRDPEELGEALEPIAAPTDSLRYDRAWYVVPDRRVMRTPNYCRLCLHKADLPANHLIVTASQFLEAVENRMTHRKLKEKE